jgi:hypothetical protein
MQKYTISTPSKETPITQNKSKMPTFLGDEFPHNLDRFETGRVGYLTLQIDLKRSD